MIQKKSVYTSIVALALLFLSSCVGTTNEPILNAVKPLFGKLPDLLNSASPDGFIYIRFVIFVAVFALFYIGTSKIFDGPKHKHSAILIAFSLSLLSTIAIPERILIGIVSTYSGFMGVLLALVPVIAGLYVAHTYFKEDTVFNRILKAIIYLLIAYILGVFNQAVTLAGGAQARVSWEGASYLYLQLQNWLPIAQLILFIAAIANLFGAFGHGAAAAVGGVRGDYNEIRGGGSAASGRNNGSGRGAAANDEDVATVNKAQNAEATQQVTRADAVAKAQAKDATDNLKKLAEAIRNQKV